MVNHIAIIMDGNRRYAEKHKIETMLGHHKGAEVVENLADWAEELNIKELTLYAFSMQNFKRSKTEFNYLMNLLEEFIEHAKDKLKKEPKVKFNFFGRLHLFSEKIQNLVKELQEISKNNTVVTMNFALGYGGREEIVDAVKKLVEKKQEITEENISNNLYLNSEPDVVIRTGNTIRTSNFLTWQTTYSEWVFLEKTWPEFTKEDLKKVVNDFSKIKRNFGA